MKTTEELTNALIIATNKAYETIIGEIQKDAYNQAVNDIAGKLTSDGYKRIGDEIVKLKKK
jgi:hypothetical protein